MNLEEIKEAIAEQRIKNSRHSIEIDNLQNKNIKDFTTEDTVYLTVKGKDNSTTYLCQFIKFENGRVFGKALQAMVNPDIHCYHIDRGLSIVVKQENASLKGKLPSDEYSHYHHCNSIGRFYDENLETPLDDMNIKTHESYGLLGFSKTSCRNMTLFGSSIKHDQIITMKISTANQNREFNRDTYYADKEIIEVAMSHSQFAEMITSFNRGDGIPCTIKTLQGKRMAEPNYISKVEQTNREFQTKMSNLSVKLKNLTEKTDAILGKTSITKADREAIKKDIAKLTQEIGANIPFVAEQFAEQMDKTISEAKSEVEAFIASRMEEKGLGGPTASGLLGDGN